MVSMTRPVFVYGTLRRGLHNYERLLSGRTEEERRAVITGRLYAADHGRFPCLVKEGNTIVQGDIMYIQNDKYDDVLEDLDRLEGYDEGDTAGSEYVRDIVTVTDERGREIEAHTYYWNQPAGLGEHITSGDWVTWLQQKHRKPSGL
ncbi:Uncharacterized conserved protein YtfP, gamma-glutamylcyclotransferase (GGCT)/AIG2-like family [Salibacterium halotolerans]|uniref:Uncharacterized conserved protein YtfP, gamma-glutamylcyclotransferase (GGCT)/AIG2-like family n=2 Tax=Salibacterium halotolerans TaxID=1884432 RepID=A0A1I5W6F2_9BACI|nr:Uncharacterized conserved protein YtfP, gamma-glutamylcyclotransferase (GGCT)/AIG2-like family [Salibacterium halotolerans]